MGPLGRLHLITDTRPGRDAVTVVAAALAAAAPPRPASPGRLRASDDAFDRDAAARQVLDGRAGDTGDQKAAHPVVVQVRVSDDTTDREAYEFAARIKELCDRHSAVCLVNDRLQIALAVGAAGGHVGADDLPVSAARRVLGRAGVLGATCRDPAGARAAVAAGASYLGVGPAFDTATKSGLPAALGPAGIAAVAAAVPDTPVIAIGGITAARVGVVRDAGAYGVAVVGAVSEAPDPAAATRALLAAVCAGSHDHGSLTAAITTRSFP